MGNPASELYEMYRELRERANSGGTLSQHLDPNTSEGYRWWARATSLLAQIDDLLRVLELDKHRVAVFRRQIPNWTTPVTGRIAGWTQGISGDHVIAEAHLEQLESLASYFDGKVRDNAREHEPELKDVVEQAHALLLEDDSLHPTLKLYLHRLLQSIKAALEDEALGERFDFDIAAERLWVAMQAASGTSNEQSSSWRELAQQMLTGTASGVLATGITTVAGALGGFSG